MGVEWNAVNVIQKVRAYAPKADQAQADLIVNSLKTGGLEVNKKNMDYLYQLNTNPKLEVPIEAQEIGNVILTSGWEKMSDGRFRATVRPIEYDKWAVFGTLSIVRRINGTYGFFDDTYNFEKHNSLKPDELLRNVNTKIGSPTCGSLSGCIGFLISFQGNYDPSNIYDLKKFQR